MKTIALLFVIFSTSGARFIIKEGGSHGSFLLVNSDDELLNINKDRAIEGIIHTCPLNKYYESFYWFINRVWEPIIHR